MKINHLIIVCAFLLVGMSSCTKTQNVYLNNRQIVTCDVGYSQWRYTGDEGMAQYDNNYYYCAYDVAQLTSAIYKDGSVQVYLVETNSRGEEYKHPLPFSRQKELINEQGEPYYYFTETYDYLYGNGWVEFNYTASDFAYEKQKGLDPQCRPESKRFEVVLTW